MDPSPLSADAAARRRALAPEGSFIVQAPAGSGKTELLIQRFLVLLARVEQPEEVVAITFTRKAAGEMRERVVAALRRGREPQPPDAAHARRTWELARAAAMRDAELGWACADYPARLRIQTIDSLCAGLTRQMPWLSRFGAQPRVADQPGELFRAAARSALGALDDPDYGPHLQRVLAHLDDDFARLEGLLAGMLARRDQWLRHLPGLDRPDGDPGGWRRELEGALAHQLEEGLAAVAAALPPGLGSQLPPLARFAAENLLAAGQAGPVTLCAGLERLPEAVPEALPLWLGLAELLLTRAGEWRKRVDARCGFPAAGKAKGAEKERLQGAKEAIQRLLAGLAGEERLRRALEGLRGLPPPRYGEERWAVLESLLVVLRLAAAELTLTFQERGEVDFAEIAARALDALGDEEAPTDLALALDHRIRHLLVDEFQDTSHLQFRLLERLTAGWQPGDGRTLFLVGDPMQSIYRFREADVGLYLRARRQGVGGVPLEPLALTVNFRSAAGVVAWVNGAFPLVMPRDEEPGSGAVAYSPSQPWRPPGEGPAVSVHPLLDGDPGAEAARVAELAAAALAAGPAATVAVLVRSRSHLAQILPALRGAGLGYQAIEIEPLAGRPVVRDLLTLTRALLHPADRLAWLALLRAPWCGLTLADLHALAGSDPEPVVWPRLAEEPLPAALSADGRARLARIRGPLAAALAERRRLPLRRWVEGVWLALDGPAALAEAAELEQAQVFLALLEGLEAGGGIEELALLEQRVAALFAPPDPHADPRLQVMTVHKSKGLEFDTVILPGLGRRPRGDDPSLLLWQETPAGDLLLAPIREAGEAEEPIYGYLRGLEGRKAHYESGRLLYVAATRARHRLHLLGEARVKGGELQAPASTSLLGQLWPVVAGEFEAAAAGLPGEEEFEEAAGGREPPPLVRLPADWRPAPPPPPAEWAGGRRGPEELRKPEFLWAGDTARRVGDLVHRELCRMGAEGPWPAARVAERRELHHALLRRLGVPEAELAGAQTRVREALLRLLEDPRGRWLLDPGHRDAHSEYALTGVDEGRLVNIVIDRTFVDGDGVRWIVDYKTGSHEGRDVDEFLDSERVRYCRQLERYGRMLGALEEGRPIRLALYFPLLGGWREWPAGEECPRESLRESSMSGDRPGGS